VSVLGDVGKFRHLVSSLLVGQPAQLAPHFGAGFLYFWLNVMFVQENGVIYAVKTWLKSQNCKQQRVEAAA